MPGNIFIEVLQYPTLQVERKLWKKGYKRVVCLDESGRGSLSGPVVAAAVLMNSRIFTNLSRNITNNYSRKFVTKFVQIRKIKDSKKLSPKAREKFYKILSRRPGIWWGIGRVSERVIDKINILEATKLAMIKAIKKLKKKPDFVILDGNFTLPEEGLARAKINLPILQKPIIKADEKVFSCAIASIIAKVTRDRIMRRYHKKYPQYGFDKHKGYPTKLHIRRLKKYGPCRIHRKSFRPVKLNLKN